MNMSLAGRIAIFYALFWSALTVVILVSTLPSLGNQCRLVGAPSGSLPQPTSRPERPSTSASDCQIAADKAGSITETQDGIIPSTGQAVTLRVEMPAQVCTEPIVVSGQIFEDQVFIDTEQYMVAFVVDVSDSTVDNRFSGQERVGDLNDDGISDTILDAEISGLLALTQSIFDANAAQNTTIGIIPFDSSAEIRGPFFAPLNIADLEAELTSLRAGGGTNFYDALQRVIDFFNQFGSQGKRNLVFFLSDGDGADNTSVATTELIDQDGINAEITAIGLGQSSDIMQLDKLDDNQLNDSAIQVFSPSDLEAGLTGRGMEPTSVDYVEISVNGTVKEQIPRSQLSQDLKFTGDLQGLSVGNHVVQTQVVFDDLDKTSVQISQAIDITPEEGNN